MAFTVNLHGLRFHTESAEAAETLVSVVGPDGVTPADAVALSRDELAEITAFLIVAVVRDPHLVNKKVEEVVKLIEAQQK